MNQQHTEVISFTGGDGSTIQSAIQIIGAQSFFSGIQAEFEFIMAAFNENDVEWVEGKTIFFPEAVIHHINIVKRNGEIKNIFFNANEFQSKIENEEIEAVKTFISIH